MQTEIESRLTVRPTVHSKVPAFVPLAICAVVLIFAFRLRQPGPASPGAFATEHAQATREAVIGQIPHPLGSSENALVRKRLINVLRTYGFEPVDQERFVCVPGACATVHNVIARLGNSTAGAVLIAAHYDSVGAGPGVSDNGGGVAVSLEIARILKANPPLARPVVFLFEDGEESGLLGAKAFAESGELRGMGAVVNLDARGTSGQVLMFETSDRNLGLIRMYAHAVRRPATGSLFQIIYKTLPNDTDFSVFKQEGFAGLNLAYIVGSNMYHTPLDDAAHSSPNTLGQLGETTLALVRGLAATDLEQRATSDAVYFDLFGQTTVWYSEWWGRCLRHVSLLLMLVAAVLAMRYGAMTWQSWPIVLALLLLNVISTGVGAWLLLRIMQLSGWKLRDAEVAAGIAMWLVSFAGVCFAATPLQSRISFTGTVVAVGTVWALLGYAVPVEASYLFVLPAAVTALVAMIATFSESRAPWTRAALSGALAAVTALLWMPIITVMHDGLGNPMLPYLAILASFSLTLLLPVARTLPREINALAALILFVAATAVGFYAAKSEQRSGAPAHLNITYLEDANQGTARWLLSGDLDSVASEMRGPFSQVKPFAWSNLTALGVTAPELAVPAPELSIIRDEPEQNHWHVRLLLRSQRHAPRGVIFVPPEFKVLRAGMGSQRFPDPTAFALKGANGWLGYRCLTLPEEGMEFEFTFESANPVRLYAVDTTFGLPAEAQSLWSTRTPGAVPFQDGDTSVALHQATISPSFGSSQATSAGKQ